MQVTYAMERDKSHVQQELADVYKKKEEKRGKVRPHVIRWPSALGYDTRASSTAINLKINL